MASKKNTAQKNAPTTVALEETNAAQPATTAQVETLCKMLRLVPTEIPADLTKGQASAKIRETIIRRNKQRALPPTENQLRWLEENGYNRSAMSERTRGYCSSLIYKTRKEKGLL